MRLLEGILINIALEKRERYRIENTVQSSPIPPVLYVQSPGIDARSTSMESPVKPSGNVDIILRWLCMFEITMMIPRKRMFTLCWFSKKRQWGRYKAPGWCEGFISKRESKKGLYPTPTPTPGQWNLFICRCESVQQLYWVIPPSYRTTSNACCRDDLSTNGVPGVGTRMLILPRGWRVTRGYTRIHACWWRGYTEDSAPMLQ